MGTPNYQRIIEAHGTLPVGLAKPQYQHLEKLVKKKDERIVELEAEVARLKTPEEFVCDVCNFKATSKAGLTAHKRSHKG